MLTNAIKFSYQKGIIDISIEVNDSCVFIKVRDHGIGISEENIQKIMKQKNPEVRNGTKDEKGSGLGLMLSVEFIETHGGRLEISKNEGNGSTFVVCLPISQNKMVQLKSKQQI